VPYPIQSGSITDRLRKFFRIRGKTGFQLDEMVAPVVLVQDLTVGPYQSGVTPAAGSITWTIPGTSSDAAFALILNDKLGSVTPVLGNQFLGRSFSITWIELQNASDSTNISELPNLILSLSPRANLVAPIPQTSEVLASIQENDGTITVPVEMFSFDTGVTARKTIWRGLLGDNVNTLGTRRIIDPDPPITIGPEDAIILQHIGTPTSGFDNTIRVSIRGFYQEQPS